MNKNLLKNPWVLVGFHLLITIIIGSILNLMDERLDIKFSSVAAAFFAALIIGQIYTFKFKELISKKMRLQVSSIAVAIQFALRILLGFFSDFTREEWRMYLVALIITAAIAFFGIYLALRLGGKSQLKLIERQEELKKKKLKI